MAAKKKTVVEKLVTITIMDRTGHSEQTVGFEDATTLIQEEMGKGKWLRVVDANGEAHIETDVAVLTADLTAMKRALMAAQSLTITMALVGGACASAKDQDLVKIDGKWYKRSQISVKGNAKKAPAKKACCKKAAKTQPVKLGVITDIDDDTIISASQNLVVLNNAHGTEAACDAVAKLMLVLNTKFPELIAGEAKVTATVDEDGNDLN